MGTRGCISDGEPAPTQQELRDRLRDTIEKEGGLIPAGDVPRTSKQPGDVFWVMKDGRKYYPAWQFDSDMKPLPIIKQILASHSSFKNGWATAAWFFTNNAFLSDRAAPANMLHKDPKAVLKAAKSRGMDF